MDCLFCKIIKGEIDSAKVYEDADVFAFLDIQPLTEGHCLVVPKRHFENIFDIEGEVLQKTALAAQGIARKVRANLRADGINFLQSNGPKAGQVVFHYHLHIIPRYENDALKIRPIWETERHEKQGLATLKELAKKVSA